MIRVYHRPFFSGIGSLRVLVDEIAAVSEAAVAFFREGMAPLCFI